VAEAKKKASLGDTGNIGADKLRKKTRKKLSHQQAAEARDTLDAEFRDLRTTVSVTEPCTHTHTHAHSHAIAPIFFFFFCISVPNVVCVGGLMLMYVFFSRPAACAALASTSRRCQPMNAAQQGLQSPGDTALAPPPPRTIPESAGFGSSVQPSEQSMQDLARILSTL
jgi:hypothetical protein